MMQSFDLTLKTVRNLFFLCCFPYLGIFSAFHLTYSMQHFRILACCRVSLVYSYFRNQGSKNQRSFSLGSWHLLPRGKITKARLLEYNHGVFTVPYFKRPKCISHSVILSKAATMCKYCIFIQQNMTIQNNVYLKKHSLYEFLILAGFSFQLTLIFTNAKIE